ncbi:MULTISPECIES: GNAT family N-acetyltransferase [unclassified Streptomyces]|uniref:GNAT family N-acetyltransferase n=1 Tax=unclassified Streptomyces TaxID=2593676 RepID=UPI001BECBCC6|nr:MULTISPECIES: GNAT family N-acetyltransferase [unclassified Streptomyces]MBT2408862.1 GNAT family N-acetyltransferase [Streptomyces sp. ISL-21]MBT2459469.1 GNAT family N-acetyltransferase [Streptomyces sp. ISL-86]MBT2611655.1 GNAT family N-acetyltransferase [Streptomyces sp. ISL-87]
MDDLLTERLVLHPMSVQEAAALTRGEAHDAVSWARGYPTEADVSGARRYLDLCEAEGDPQPFGPYEIRRREDGCVIGGLGFHGPPDPDGTVTIGYGLVAGARGHGYAAEALRALLLFARTQGVSRVAGDTDHGNIASQRVMAAAGMKLVSEDEYLKYYTLEWPPSRHSTPGRQGHGRAADE